MGDMREDFDFLKKLNKELREQRLEDAQPILGKFIKHTEYHYGLWLVDSKLDYWPSTSKWRWRNKNYWGKPQDLLNFIRKRARD